MSGLVIPSTTASRRKSFDRFRMLINAAATLKLARLPPGFVGLLAFWGEDLRSVPRQVDLLVFGSAGRAA